MFFQLNFFPFPEGYRSVGGLESFSFTSVRDPQATPPCRASSSAERVVAKNAGERQADVCIFNP